MSPGVDSAFNRNEYQRSSLGGGGGVWWWLVVRTDNFVTYICRLSENHESLNLLETSGPIMACTMKQDV
jgi:hypothetical protein